MILQKAEERIHMAYSEMHAVAFQNDYLRAQAVHLQEAQSFGGKSMEALMSPINQSGAARF